MSKLLAVIGTVAAVVLGVWVTGAVLTQDATVAMVLTGGWFALAGGLALLVAWRRRPLAWPVVGAWLVTSTVVGGYLLLTSTVDQVADEDVLAAPSATASRSEPDMVRTGDPSASGAGPRLLAAGRFRDGAHPTDGRASLIEVADGSRVLTLTEFATDPGPDLRVYLVPGDGFSVSGALDLGRLHGNKGDQQYDVPAGAPDGAVVIWCRAFSVAFGSASLG